MEKTIVCISCYYKGYDFMDEMKKLGNKVILITSENIKTALAFGFDDVALLGSIWNNNHSIENFKLCHDLL